MPSPPPRRAVAVLLAAGAGSRVGAETTKVLLPVAGRPVLAWSLATLRAVEYVDQVVVVGRAVDRAAVTALLGPRDLFVEGGATRAASEQAAFLALRELPQHRRVGDDEVVAVHDSARPFATPALWCAVIEAAAEHGGAVPVRPQRGLLRRDGSPLPGLLAGMQTPQAFRAGTLFPAYDRAIADGFSATDTAGCVAAYAGARARAVPGPATNLKITFAGDLAVAERLMAAHPPV